VYVLFCFLGGGKEGLVEWFSLSEYWSIPRFHAVMERLFWPNVEDGRLVWCNAGVHVHIQLQVVGSLELPLCAVWKLEDWNGLSTLLYCDSALKVFKLGSMMMTGAQLLNKIMMRLVHMIWGHTISMWFPHAVERNVKVRFQGRIQKQTYRENDCLLCYYGCLRETKVLWIHRIIVSTIFQ